MSKLQSALEKVYILRRIAHQEWYETDTTKTGWDSHGWFFDDEEAVTSEWEIETVLEQDKFYNPIKATFTRRIAYKIKDTDSNITKNIKLPEEGNKLIESFWIEQGGRPHLETDLSFYESDWEMLMPVVEKIAELLKDHHWTIEIMSTYNSVYFWSFESERQEITNQSENKLIDSIWNAVVDFIQWYNKK